MTRTLHRSWGQDVLIHVVQVVRQEEVLGGRSAQAQKGGVKVEGGCQGSQTRVVDQGEAGQRLDLLPAMELLSQGGRHLPQGLSEGGGQMGGVNEGRWGRLGAQIGPVWVVFDIRQSGLTWQTGSCGRRRPGKNCERRGTSRTEFPSSS